jgi:hypothetical protein
MAADQTDRRDWILYERVARSLAHTVGNTINVVSGRLSLLERQSGTVDDVGETLRRARGRLLTLQEELRFALHLPPEEMATGALSLAHLLEQAGKEPGVELGNRELLGARGALLTKPNEFALSYLADACRILNGGAVSDWQLGTRVVRDQEAFTLSLTLDAQRVPQDRKALLEPWFSKEVEGLAGDARYGRLLLAQALGLLEESGAALSVLPASSGSTAVVLVWAP